MPRVTRWLDDEEQDAWRQLAAVITRLPAALDTQLQRDADLTHFGYWVLAMLSEEPTGPLRMSELAARANSSLSRLSHGVGRLEKQGWVRRERSPDDGRGSVAVLTDAGPGQDRAGRAGPRRRGAAAGVRRAGRRRRAPPRRARPAARRPTSTGS